MSVYIKRLILLFAIAFITVGVRLSDNGLCSLGIDGRYSYYSTVDEVTVLDEAPLFSPRGEYERIDLSGGVEDANRIISRANAVVKAKESFDGLTVIYAYTTRISNFVTVGGERVNLMIAISDGRVAVGSPLLKGSY